MIQAARVDIPDGIHVDNDIGVIQRRGEKRLKPVAEAEIPVVPG